MAGCETARTWAVENSASELKLRSAILTRGCLAALLLPLHLVVAGLEVPEASDVCTDAMSTKAHAVQGVGLEAFRLAPMHE